MSYQQLRTSKQPSTSSGTSAISLLRATGIMSLLGVIISAGISVLICTCATQHALQVIATCYRAHKLIRQQQAKAIVRYYISRDATNAARTIRACQHSIYPCQGQVLILTESSKQVAYYLRRSVLSSNQQIKYALYRDEQIHNAQALVENVLSWQLETHKITIFFSQTKPMEIIWPHQATLDQYSGMY